jgi:hypothetical protein
VVILAVASSRSWVYFEGERNLNFERRRDTMGEGLQTAEDVRRTALATHGRRGVEPACFTRIPRLGVREFFFPPPGT